MSQNLYINTFNESPAFNNFTPGRVNLIGEHTDYNGGYVLPTALRLGLDISMSPRPDNQVNIISSVFAGLSQRQLEDNVANHWSDYALGCLKYANEFGILTGGADIAITSNLPKGAGLSSSAAITVGLLKLCAQQSTHRLNDVDVAKLAQKIENEFIGVPCGIMDQMAVAIAKSGEALKLDTTTLDYSIIPMPTDHSMVIIHSGHYRQLKESRYKERKEECDLVKDALGRQDICLINDDDLAKLSELPSRIQRRARHCMSEHQRTLKAASALTHNDMETFGKLMIKSHISMRDDFEITIAAIDKIVEDAVELGALGARMTGGGFGGCIVACLDNDKAENWTGSLLEKHPKAFLVA